MRISRRARVVAGVCAALAVVITPALLFAHARLVRSVPAADARLDAAPKALSLWFSESPELRFTTLQLVDSTGIAVALGAVAKIPDEGMGVTAPVVSSLANGRYTVVWRTAAADGHATSGRFSFVVGALAPAIPPPSADTVAHAQRKVPNTVIEPARSTVFSTAARWAELMAVLTLVGAMIFRLFVLREARLPADITTDASDRARRLAHAVLGLFIVTTFWRLSAQADLIPTAATARIAAMITVVRDTGWGRGWLVGAVGGVVAALGLLIAKRSLAGWVLATLGVVTICFAEGFTGHAGVLRQRVSLAMAIDLAHLFGAGGWLGGLGALLLCGFPATVGLSDGERARTGQILVRSYHRAAIECVALTLITAALAVWMRLATPADLWMTAYGRVLLVKFTLVIAMLAFGFYHWRTVVTPTWNDDTGFRFKRSATMELLVGACIVGATAVLVSTALPR